VNKEHKRELVRLAELAYERELGHWLSQLQVHFNEWQRGGITASELCDHVHEFHQGPARVVWSRHAALERPETRVAWGIARGLLAEREVDPAVLDVVRATAEVFRQLEHG
jgi:hypothetical protein